MNRRLELAIAAALIIVGAVSLLAQRFLFVDPTNDRDWALAAAWVGEHIGPDDIVRIEPHWREASLTHFVDLGDQVDRIRDPLLEDYHRYDGVFVVSEAGRVDRAHSALPFPSTDISHRRSFGTVEAFRVDVPDDTYVWELADALGDATISRVRGDEVERCSRWDERNHRWDCARRDRWLYVAREMREVGDEPRHCVYAHPLDGGRTLRIEATVPPSDTIRVRDSFSLRAARLPRSGEVLLQVFVEDALKVEDRVAHDDHGFEAHDIDVSHLDGPVKLRLEVDLVGSIKDRFFCLNAWAAQAAD